MEAFREAALCKELTLLVFFINFLDFGRFSWSIKVLGEGGT